MMNSNNVFANAARTVANMTTTENGHAAASTTGSALLDLYGQVGALRGQDEKRICQLLDAAVAEDPLLARKIIFYARDCRGGTGEREVFRTLLRHMATKYPSDALMCDISLIPEFGRWDDLYSLIGTPLESQMWDEMNRQLFKDEETLAEGKPVSLLGKWLKSCNASSKETRRLGRMTAEQFGYSEKEYRKLLSRLRERIRVVECQMSAQKWDKIDYETVPSKAGLIYRDTFRKHDEERYKAYISSVERGEKKINASMNTPQDLVHAYGAGWGMKPEDPTIEAMWKNLPNYINSDENVLVMADVSGSMTGRPMEVSLGLAMYFAQRNTGAFHNLFMTFESEPHFFELKEHLSFHDNLERAYNAPWGGSTDLNRACEAMLEMAVRKHVPEKDMPTRLVIVSDMEINEASGHYGVRWVDRLRRYVEDKKDFSDILHVDELREMYERAGYKMPQVIYWNVESRDNHFQTRSDVPGTMLASGSSPRVFEAVMAMKDYQVTPYDAMLEVLNGERYKEVK